MGIGIWELLIVLIIVLLIFGGKRLANLGKDLGGAIKGFKQAVKDEDANENESAKSKNSLNNNSRRDD
jgi:sec-independent protein translocase protein TatA